MEDSQGAKEAGSSVSQTNAFIANRMSLIIPPATAKVIKAKAKKKASRKSHMIVLKNFVDLPLDIIYETVAYLEPSDLLTLARLSKEFRALFLSRTSLAIWKRVLSEVPNLPPCPQDLSEPQYASLMFEKFCMACGSSRGSIATDYKTRLRLCATCSRTNLSRGYDLRAKCVGFSETALTLLPFYSYDFFCLGFKDLPSTKNDLSMYYFKPEAELFIKELAKRADTKSDEYTRFVTQQQENASRMINEGIEIMGYKENLLQAHEEAEEELAERRHLRIKEEMHALGWEAEYFPRWSDEEDFDKWDEYMFQPKEFTARGWSLIRPKLTVIYNRTKQCRQIEQLSVRTLARYTDFRAAQSVEARRRLPLWGDLCMLPFMLQFFLDNHADCSDDMLTELMETIVDGTQGFLGIIERDLARIISRCDRTQVLEKTDSLPESDLDMSDSDELGTTPILTDAKSLRLSSLLAKANSSSGADTSAKAKGKAKASPSTSATDMLTRASNMFICVCSTCSFSEWDNRRVLSYPNVLDHIDDVIRDNDSASKRWIQMKPVTTMEVMHAAQDVLAALGLEEDCTRAEVDAMGEFVCDCRHHVYKGPLSFDQLVDHVYKQQMGHNNLVRNTDNESKYLIDRLLVNGHSREHLFELVRVATDKDRLSSMDSNEGSSPAVENHSAIPAGRYCRYCYRLVLEAWAYDETMAYHLKYMHGKEVQVDDFETFDVLRKRYGERFNDSLSLLPFFYL